MTALTLSVSILLASQVTFPENQPDQSRDRIAIGEAENAASGSVSSRPLKSVLRTSAEVEEAAPGTTESPLVPVKSQFERGAAPELLTQSLTPPAEGALTGRKYSLLEVLGRTPDRNQQIMLTRAYWKLSLAMADYYFAIDENQRLETVGDDSPGGASLLQSAKTAAAARVREAELAAMTAQHELAELIYLPSGEPLPVTADVPHVGPYRTYFETLFSAQAPPGRARLIDRALPVRREAIELRAAAAQSALEATDAAAKALTEGQADVRLVLGAHEALRTERRAFLADVRDYNHDIAEYAMTVAQIGTSEVVLVGMLIKSPQSPQPSERREPTPAVAPGQAGPNASDEPGQFKWRSPAQPIPGAEGSIPQRGPGTIPRADPTRPFDQPTPPGSVLSRPAGNQPTPAAAPGQQ